ncbi:MAG: hypothetical protein DWQ10_15220, partial [Calditrichaeota bacterium]
DIAVGPRPDPNLSYIYLADIGDNDRKRNVRSILRIPEPTLSPGTKTSQKIIHNFDKIRFSFPDGPRDAETLLLDPQTLDLFIISKRDANAHVYKIAYPQKTESINKALHVASIRMTMVVSGDISQDGSGILLKTYGSVYYWKRHRGESIQQVLNRKGKRIDYFPEPQGEAICWAPFQTGYFTLSEELLGIPCRLVYYDFSSNHRPNHVTQADMKSWKKAY